MSEELKIKIKNYLAIADSLENTIGEICISCSCNHCPLFNDCVPLTYARALCNKTRIFLESVEEYGSKNG